MIWYNFGTPKDWMIVNIFILSYYLFHNYLYFPSISFFYFIWSKASLEPSDLATTIFFSLLSDHISWFCQLWGQFLNHPKTSVFPCSRLLHLVTDDPYGWKFQFSSSKTIKIYDWKGKDRYVPKRSKLIYILPYLFFLVSYKSDCATP